MSDSKFVQNYVFLVRSGVAGAAREVKPSSWTPYNIGTVSSLTPRHPGGKTVIEKPIGGVWRDYDVKRETDKLEIAITVAELSADFWKLVWHANPTLTAGAANYVPGSAMNAQGWVQVQQYSDGGVLQNTVEIFADVEIESQDFGRGIIGAQFLVTKLYSTLNSGSFAGLTY